MSLRSRRNMTAVFGFALVAILFATAFRVAVVHGSSMMPTYDDGEMVLVNRLPAYRKSPQKGDVVLVRKGDDVLIKRIAYLPGDLIDGEDAGSLAQVRQYFVTKSAPTTRNPWHIALQVPDGYAVVLGDNRAVSDDSRSFGPVSMADILGIVVNSPPRP